MKKVHCYTRESEVTSYRAFIKEMMLVLKSNKDVHKTLLKMRRKNPEMFIKGARSIEASFFASESKISVEQAFTYMKDKNLWGYTVFGDIQAEARDGYTMEVPAGFPFTPAVQ